MTEARAVGRIVVGGLALLFAFTAIYVAAYHAPRAKGFDVGVVGTPVAGAGGRSSAVCGGSPSSSAAVMRRGRERARRPPASTAETALHFA
jgi:hypothetical protein